MPVRTGFQAAAQLLQGYYIRLRPTQEHGGIHSLHMQSFDQHIYREKDMQFSRFPTETTQRLFILPIAESVMDLQCFRLKTSLPEPVRYFGNHMLKIFLVFTEDKHFLYLFRKITPD